MKEESSNNQKSWLHQLANFFTKDPSDRQDIKAILRDASDRNVLDNEMLAILEGALHVSDMQVREVMVPKSQMVCIPNSNSLQDILPAIIDSSHSRFPVLNEHSDEVLGILLAKDLLSFINHDSVNSFQLKNVLRAATFVPESKRLNILLREFKATRNHMAIVVDEFGSMAGLVTIEDVLEQIVGDIEDEHDIDENDSFIKVLTGTIAMVKAVTPVEDFNKHFETKLNESSFDTIGGVVMHQFGRVPDHDEQIIIGSLQFKVVNGSNRGISLLEVSQVKT
jgi:magnesium and cobalt transporter